MLAYAKHPRTAHRTKGSQSNQSVRVHSELKQNAHTVCSFPPAVQNRVTQPARRSGSAMSEADVATSRGSSLAAFDSYRTAGYTGASEFFQAKYTINTQGDKYEQEADRVANHAMSLPDSIKNSHCACGGGCPSCRNSENAQQNLQIKPAQESGTGNNVAPPTVHEALHSSSQPLDSNTRTFMESRFGRDFSQVKIHNNAESENSAQMINARAYTVGQHIAFGKNQYAPQTTEGKHLLAHELTHVVQQKGKMLQRKSNGPEPEKKNSTYSVTTTGCDKTPYSNATVEAAAKKAYIEVRDTGCILTDSLKQNILAEFSDLEIKCKEGKDKPCGKASSYFSNTVTIYPSALDAGCGPLEATILHEVIHLAEYAPYGHGVLAIACEKSCFGWGSGDASKCTYDTGFVPVAGISAGAAFSEKGSPALHGRLYVGIEKRGPILGFVHPSFGIGVGLIGESASSGPDTSTSGPSQLVSLLAGIRLDPVKPGGGHISFFGGPALAVGNGKGNVGAEAGMALGYRWRWLDFSVDAGVAYDPTRESGMNSLFTLGASIKIGPSLPR